MSSKIVSLSGDTAFQAAEPEKDVVALLEELLGRAKAGDIQAVGLVYMDSRKLCAFSASGYLGAYALVGAVEHLKTHLISCGS